MIRVTFTEPSRFFICANEKKPKFKIKGSLGCSSFSHYMLSLFRKKAPCIFSLFLPDATLFLRACLLKPEAEAKIVRQLHNNQLQIPYVGQVFKTYSVPIGSPQAEIDISLKVR